MIGDLHGRVAVVTGAASGIGFALCERFLAEGMRVVMADVDRERLETAAGAFDGEQVLAVATDSGRWDSVEELARRTHERFGAAHVLCNNAGVQRPARAWECSVEDWSWLLSVNLSGVFYGVKAFVPAMLERGEPGHVVNTASIGGLLAFGELAPYCASKYGVVGFSESLHHDLRAVGASIGVSVLCPGAVATQLRAHSRQLHADGGHGIPDRPEAAVGMAPATVAELVLDAIRAERFWILTNPEYAEPLDAKLRGIVESGDVVEPLVY